MYRSRGQHFRGLHSALGFPSAPVLAPPTPARQTQRPVNHRHGRGPRRHGSLHCDKRSDGMKRKKKKKKKMVCFVFRSTYFPPAIFNLETLRINTQGS